MQLRALTLFLSFQTSPVLVQDLITHEFMSVAAGAAHSVAVTAQGQTFVWGRGDCGQVCCSLPCMYVLWSSMIHGVYASVIDPW